MSSVSNKMIQHEIVNNDIFESISYEYDGFVVDEWKYDKELGCLVRTPAYILNKINDKEKEERDKNKTFQHYDYAGKSNQV